MQEFLRDGQLSVDIFGIVRAAPSPVPVAAAVTRDERLSSTFAVGEESAAFGASTITLRAAEPVVVRSTRWMPW